VPGEVILRIDFDTPILSISSMWDSALQGLNRSVTELLIKIRWGHAPESQACHLVWSVPSHCNMFSTRLERRGNVCLSYSLCEMDNANPRDLKRICVERYSVIQLEC
jgi:hypothetical protein